MLELGVWVIKKTVDGVSYIWYGRQPTTEELVLKELEEVKKELHELKNKKD